MRAPALLALVAASLLAAVVASRARADCPANGSQIAIVMAESERLAAAGDRVAAMTCVDAALQASLGGREERARLQLWAAAWLEASGEYARARSRLADATALAQSGSSAVERTAIAAASGWIEYRLANYVTAEQVLTDAVAKGSFGSQRELAEALDHLATVQRERAEYDAASATYARALALVHDDYSDAGQLLHARILNDRGGQHTYQSEFRSAIEQYEQALEIYGSIGMGRSGDAAKALNNLGDAYRELGEYAQARSHLQRALEIKTQLFGPDHVSTASTLTNLGMVAEASDDGVAAQNYYARALAIYEKALGPSHASVASVAAQYGRLQFALGKYAQSLELLERARAIRERRFGTDSNWEAETLVDLVPVYSKLGSRAKARRGAELALSIAVTGGEQQLLYACYIGYARALASQGHLDAAVFFGKQAVNVIQRMREDIAPLAVSERRAFLVRRELVYRDLADWLITSGRLHETEEILNLLKLEEVSAYTDAGELEGRRAMRAAMVGREAQSALDLEQLIHATATGPVTAHAPGRSARRAEFSAGLQRIVQALSQVRPAASPLGPVGAGAMSDGTAVVHYLVLPNKVRILLRTRATLLERSVSIDRAELSHQVYDLQHGMRARLESRNAARTVYDLLIAPLAAQLQADGIHVLVLMPDDVLRYVPFAALTDGRRYLIESYALLFATPASEVNTPPGSMWSSAAAFGVSKTPQGRVLLPNVPAELRYIVRESTGNPNGVLPGVILLDAQFTRRNAVTVLGQGYPVVHIASHFVFRSGSLRDSYLLLGDGSQLSLDAISTGALPLRGVGMLTLSACETAVGQTGADGREIESFAALAQRKGARNVMATLWAVPDLSTSVLMAKFYRTLVPQHAQPAQYAGALREAQLLLLHGPSGGSTQAPRYTGSPYTDPFFWAPFILLQPLR
jgi:CHAT domain-containing protein/tetratricopeptide (TPR) repeat protein